MAFLSIFRLARLLPALPFPCLRDSYRFRLLWRRGVGRIVGGVGVVWLLVASSCFIRSVPAARSISLVSACGQVAVCAVFVSSFSCVVCWWLERIVFPYLLRSSVRLVPLLVLPVSCGVSWLFFFCDLPFVSSGGSSLVVRLARRSLVPCLGVSSCPVSWLSASSVASRQAIRILSFRSAARFSGSWGGSYPLCLSSRSFSVLVSSVCCVSWP